MPAKTRRPVKLTSLPAPLSRGEAFHKAAIEGFELSSAEVELLVEVSHLLDEDRKSVV